MDKSFLYICSLEPPTQSLVCESRSQALPLQLSTAPELSPRDPPQALGWPIESCGQSYGSILAAASSHRVWQEGAGSMVHPPQELIGPVVLV